MGKKVLVLGVGQNNFLSFLYGSLKQTYPDFTITVPYFQEVEKSVPVSDWMYDNGSLAKSTGPFAFLQALFSILFSGHFYQTFFFILFFEKKMAKAMHFLFASVKEKAFFIANDTFGSIDTFHFHYLQYSYLRSVFFVPKSKKIVCSFWGSDLMRTSDTFNHYFVKKALERATVITCQSGEMKEIILSKFGRHLYDKIEINNFPIDEAVFSGIDTHSNNQPAITEFKDKYGFSKEKWNVVIGHNGNPQNNHLACIEALSGFTEKEKIHIVINLCYGLPVNEYDIYKSKLVSALKDSGFSFVIVEKFFTGEELVLSRLATDVFIHVPVSDALSATLTEMMYAGISTITGAWLPYSTLRKIGLHYHEVSDFNELSHKLQPIIQHFEAEKQKAKANQPLIRDYFFRKEIIEKWAEILS